MLAIELALGTGVSRWFVATIFRTITVVVVDPIKGYQLARRNASKSASIRRSIVVNLADMNTTEFSVFVGPERTYAMKTSTQIILKKPTYSWTLPPDGICCIGHCGGLLCILIRAPCQRRRTRLFCSIDSYRRFGRRKTQPP